MEEKRIYEMDMVKQEDKKAAKKTPLMILLGVGLVYSEPEKENPLKKGHVIVSPKGACHGAMNTGTEDIVFVSIVAPVPADYDPIGE